MRKLLYKKHGASTIEYVMVIMVVLAALLIMQKYLFRAVNGRWRSVGDSWGYGRQYDPAKTKECAFEIRHNIDQWVDANCGKAGVDACPPGDGNCEKTALLACVDVNCIPQFGPDGSQTNP